MAASSLKETTVSVSPSDFSDEQIIRFFPRYLRALGTQAANYRYSLTYCGMCGETPDDSPTLKSLDQHFEGKYLDLIDMLTKVVTPFSVQGRVSVPSKILSCEKCTVKLRRMLFLYKKLKGVEKEFTELRESVGSHLLAGSAQALGISSSQTRRTVNKWKTSNKNMSRYFPHRIPVHRPNENSPASAFTHPKKPVPDTVSKSGALCSVIRLWTQQTGSSSVTSPSSKVESPSPPNKEKPTPTESVLKDGKQEPDFYVVDPRTDPKLKETSGSLTETGQHLIGLLLNLLNALCPTSTGSSN